MIALGSAAGLLIEHFPALGGDAMALAKIFEALAIVIKDGVVHAFEWVGDSIKNVTVDTHALSGGFGVLQAVLHPLLELLHEMGDLLHYVQDQASHAVDKLMELAGMSPAAPNIAGTKDVNEAAKELGVTLKKKSDDTPAANDASAKQITAPHVSDAAAASPAAAATNAGTTLSTPAIAAVAAASVGPVLAAVGSPAMQAIAGPLAATQPRAKQAPAYRDIRTELTDATPDTEGNYHVRSNSGGGIGGTLTAEMYQNLRRRNAEQQSGTAPHLADDGPDSIALWKRGRTQAADSIAQRVSQFSPAARNVGGGGAGGGTVGANFHVTLQTKIDGNETATTLAAKILPVLKKMMAEHDQTAAGRLTAQAVSSAMGGGA